MNAAGGSQFFPCPFSLKGGHTPTSMRKLRFITAATLERNPWPHPPPQEAFKNLSDNERDV